MAMSQPTRLPSGLNDEGHIFTTAVLSLTLRQLAALLGGVFMWYLSAELIGGFMPTVFAWLLASPVLIAGIACAFVKRRGRPIDDYLADKLRSKMEPSRYALINTDAETVRDATWEDD